ncbi:hypothetical protein GCM10010270_06480 [Streptomyces violaceus]|nr:hypothetical protein GCM10010270_06480 [Streptomyces janthinus]
MVASTTTGDRRAVRAKGRGRERTAPFRWGTDGAERVRTADGTTVSHESPWCGSAVRHTTGGNTVRTGAVALRSLDPCLRRRLGKVGIYPNSPPFINRN